MGFFNNVFNSTETKKINWILIQNSNQLNEIVELSNNTPVLIFKHSTRCGISKTVLKRFEKEYNPNLPFTLFYLDLLNYRDISTELSKIFEVMHESPQILVIKNEVCVYTMSHEGIDATKLNLL